jgi:hypothetical protein
MTAFLNPPKSRKYSLGKFGTNQEQATNGQACKVPSLHTFAHLCAKKDEKLRKDESGGKNAGYIQIAMTDGPLHSTHTPSSNNPYSRTNMDH